MGAYPLVTFMMNPSYPSHGKFCSFCFQNSFFPPRKWMNSISNWLSTALIKYLN